MMRSTRLHLAAPSTNSLNLRTLPVLADASKRAVVLVSSSATCLRRVVVGARPKDEVDIVGAAPVDELRIAVVAVGPDQNPGIRPVAPDRPHQTAQVGAD